MVLETHTWYFNSRWWQSQVHSLVHILPTCLVRLRLCDVETGVLCVLRFVRPAFTLGGRWNRGMVPFHIITSCISSANHITYGDMWPMVCAIHQGWINCGVSSLRNLFTFLGSVAVNDIFAILVPCLLSLVNSVSVTLAFYYSLWFPMVLSVPVHSGSPWHSL